MPRQPNSITFVPKRWWFILPLGLLVLLFAHDMALIYRIQPAVSLWFPPSGVAIALTLWWGPVGILLTAVSSILIAPHWGNDGWTQILSLTDATEPLVAWFLYRRCFLATLSLSRLRDAVAFILSAPLAACATSAIVGSFTLVAVGKMPLSDVHTSILHWWLGNALGTLAIAPTALLLLTPFLQRWGWLPLPNPPNEPNLVSCRQSSSFWAEVVAIVVFAIATAALTVSKSNNAGFVFQQFSFLGFIPILWAAIRFGVTGGTLTSSFCVLVTLLAYLLSYPQAVSSPSFPLAPEILFVHKLSLLVQCAVSLLVGCATTEQEVTQVAQAVEGVRLLEHQARAQLNEQLLQLNSELKEANTRLQESNREKDELLLREQRALAESVSEAARSAEARKAAEAANRIKDEFLAVLSHELRTPLNPILGWSNVLRSRQCDADTTERALETIERNAKLLTQLIDDLLDVSRILQGKLSFNACPVNLVSTIEAAIETVYLAAQAKSIQIQTFFDWNVGQVLGDPNRLQQVVWNLLSNAVKFTPEGGRVEVRLSVIKGLKVNQFKAESWEDKIGGDSSFALQRSNLQPFNLQPSTSYAQIQVSDTGEGIHPDFLPHVFEYFRQADSTTTRVFGGLGLGLAIVRRLVELHGGTVCVESPGKGLGATFSVTLPLMVEPPSCSEKNV
ncbi:MASE1 domain-containing protein [Allocoleopsis sp.]|uniref:sensor histidine kinase n=1 Tax=Allocoleopsis sp. TaxID=3088169 RepID=UPI002FD65762